ncbi:MAG: class I SAM-dependent methyltransferase [Pirellulales bacterium]
MDDLSNRTTYGRMARFYDWCADLGSLGAIPFVKKLHLQYLRPGDSIIYVGAGTAEEAVLAARRGHRVFLLDSSSQMLAVAWGRVWKAGLESEVTLLHEDFFSWKSPLKVDAVALHFFLDLFNLEDVKVVLERAKGLLNSEGRIFVADFSCPNGVFLVRFAQWCYQQGAALSCALLAKQPWHPVLDYALACENSGMTIEQRLNVGWRWFGKSWFVFLSAKVAVSA